MLTDLDAELFPDTCEVVEIPPRGRCVYPIFKNGRSTIILEADKNRWKFLTRAEISALREIDVYLRDPRERWISGVNTWVQKTLEENPGLDRASLEHVAIRYRFLNRHMLPQWHWLLNLARFISPECQISFLPMAKLSEWTLRNNHAGIDPVSQDLIHKTSQCAAMEQWFYLDQILFEIDQPMTWQQIKSFYQDKHPDVWSDVTKIYNTTSIHVLR